MIPRTLFQTFKTKVLTPEFQTWKEKNPEYTYRFYDDQMCDSFMKNFDTRVWKAYRRIIPGAFKADLWRYCVLYTYGGVYADMDTICLGKIDDFLNDATEFVGIIDIKQSLLMFNAFIAAAPGSKILKACIDQMVCYIETNTVPEDRANFACGTLAIEMNKFLGRAEHLYDLTGQHGWHGNVHLLHYDEDTHHVYDTHGNVLFQNRYGNQKFNELYISELNKVNESQWWYVKDNFLKPLTMKVAVYNGFPFHYETIGHLVDYCKSRQYELDVYSKTENSWGWFDYYGIQPKSPEEYTHEGFDRVFILTDDDWTFPVTPDEKIICIEHVDFQRRSGNIKRVTFKHRQGVPFIFFTFSVPRLPKTLRICILGGQKNQTCKYPIETVCIGRENPIDATEMMRVLSSCQYMLLLNFPNFHGTSGTISMSFTCGCRLVTTKNFIDEYGLKSAIDYDATDELVSLDPSDVYEEAERFIEQRNQVYDSLFLTPG